MKLLEAPRFSCAAVSERQDREHFSTLQISLGCFLRPLIDFQLSTFNCKPCVESPFAVSCGFLGAKQLSKQARGYSTKFQRKSHGLQPPWTWFQSHPQEFSGQMTALAKAACQLQICRIWFDALQNLVRRAAESGSTRASSLGESRRWRFSFWRARRKVPRRRRGVLWGAFGWLKHRLA